MKTYGIIFVVKVVILMTLLINTVRECIAIAPRLEALETPIEVVKEQARDWSGNDLYGNQDNSS